MKITVQDVIDKLIEPAGRLAETVDTLQFGDPRAEVAGIVTAFMPTQRVLERALELKANLVIVHEPLFYCHQLTESYERDVLDGDPVYAAKRELIVRSGLNVFRFHDYWHRYQPDGITMGLLEDLDWIGYVKKHGPHYTVVELPAMTPAQVAGHIKSRLGLAFVRVAGDAETPCVRIGILAGNRGRGERSIPLFHKEKLDLIICGEGPEWETPEYVRDAVRQGRKASLIVLGHLESEEPGMKALARLLRTWFPGIPAHFVPEEPVFRIL